MVKNPHKECCIKILGTLNRESQKIDKSISTALIKELVKSDECVNENRIRTSIRELVRFGYLERANKGYKVYHKEYDRALMSINKLKKNDVDIEILYSMLPKSEFIPRQIFNEIYKDYSTPDIDQIILKLNNMGLIKKVGGKQSRGKYYVRKDKNDSLYSINPIKEIAGLYKNVVYCFHTALELNGLSRYGMTNTIYINRKIPKGSDFQNQFTIKTINLPDVEFGIIKVPYEQYKINITSLERTIVDCIDKPKHAIGWENILYALNKIETLNEDKLLKYLKILKKPSLYAKVGYILEHYKEKWDISSITIIELRQLKPRNPVRFFRNMPGPINKNWNLYIPENIFEK